MSAQDSGFYVGSGDDLSDGFMHFSTADQLAESAARHRAGVADLLLIENDPDDLGTSLKWEPSRGGQLFPHLYGTLEVARVVNAEPLSLDKEGYHIFPEGIAPWHPEGDKLS